MMPRSGIARCVRAGQWLGASLGEVLFSRWGTKSPRSLLATAALWLLVVGAGLGLNRQCFRRADQPVLNDQHANLCLEMAIHNQRFGCIAHTYRKPPSPTSTPIYVILPNNAALLSERLRDLPERCNPSTRDYVQHLWPSVNNENSLMLIDRTVLWLVPDITLAGMIQAHTLLKVGCLAVFVFFLLRVGFSPLLSLGALHVALLLVRAMSATHAISLYPFLVPMVLFLVALSGLALSFGLHLRLWLVLPALLVVGLVGAFLANLRSSHFPIMVAVTLVFITIAAIDARRRRHLSLARTGLMVAACLGFFVAGAHVFTALYIAPIETIGEDGKYGTYTNHVIAHPLAVFLSIPANDLATREGIVMEDSCGLTLARRIDPAVGYLGENYDRALFVYYFKLWVYYPAEMVQLYRLKFKAAATTAAQATLIGGKNSPRLLQALTAPLRTGANWLFYLGLFAALALAPIFLTRSLTAGRAFALSALATVGSLLFVEQALFPSNFVLTYNSFVFFWIVFVGMLGYQALLDGACLMVTRRRTRIPSAQPAAEPTILPFARPQQTRSLAA